MTLLAVPSDAPGGFDADISGHFGHCDAFSLFRIDGGKVVESAILPAFSADHACAHHGKAPDTRGGSLRLWRDALSDLWVAG